MSQISRRNFLSMLGAGSAVGMLAPQGALAKMTSIKQPQRSISLYNVHTGEFIETTFWDEGFYIDDSLASLNHHLRDHRTNQLAQMEPKLFDLLFSLQDLIGFNQPIHVFSGYRSPKTNAMLATRSSKVAKKSLHMQGKAMDLRVPGVDLKKLHKAAISLQAGGVGFYPRSGFIHLDVGRVRYW